MAYHEIPLAKLGHKVQIGPGHGDVYDIDALGQDDGASPDPDAAFRLLLQLGQGLMIYVYVVGMARFFESTMSFGCGPPPGKGPSKPRPPLREATSLNAGQTRAVAKRQAQLGATLEPCREQDPEAEGSASLRLTLCADGKVESARFAETTLSFDSLECVLDVVLEVWTFDGLPAGTVLAIDQGLPRVRNHR